MPSNAEHRRFLIAFAIIMSVISSPAHAASTGSITGQVTDGSKGLANIVVHVCHYDYQYMTCTEDVGTATSDVNGNYFVAGLPGGDYDILFDGGTTGYASLWFGNWRTHAYAQTVLVNPPNVSTANAHLVPGGGISGKITDGTTGVAGVWVLAIDVFTGYISDVSTSADGTYSLNGLTAGSYKILADGCVVGYMSTSLATASTVTVSNGQYLAYGDIVISPGATISGTVTNGSSGIDRVYVLATNIEDGSKSQYTYSTSSGQYAISGLEPGNYQTCFKPYDAGYLPECYNGVAWSPAGAGEILSVTGQQVIQNVDAVLSPGGAITGAVTDGLLGIYRTQVTAYDSDGLYIASVLTSYPSGSYYIGGLSSGTYQVCFDSADKGYISECYGNHVAVVSGLNSDPIQVTAPNTTTNIDAVLAPGGSIAGRVTNGVTGLSDIFVAVRDTNWNWHLTTSTNALGEYVVKGLSSGTYEVHFADYYHGPAYAGHYYSSPIEVTSPGSTTGIDVALSIGGSISGIVTNNTIGTGDAYVYVYDTNWKWWGVASTDSSGNYTVEGLATGTYNVGFSFNGYNLYVYNVTVVAPANTPSINAAFSMPITYTVTINAGQHGSINPPSSNQTVESGKTLSLTVMPDAGYTATVGGTCGGSLSGNMYTTNSITGPCTVSVMFTLNHLVTATTGSGGTFSPATALVSHGSTTTFTITPNTGYTATLGGTCGGSLSGNTFTTNAITSDCTVSVTFTLNQYMVTATAGSGGTISPAAALVSHGSNTTFTVTPNTGYTATVGGTCGGSLSGNTFTTNAITNACTVSATFSLNQQNQNKYTVTATAGAGGSIIPASALVSYGSKTTFTVTPNTGYTATVGGTCGGSLSGKMFTTSAITSPCTVSVTFIQVNADGDFDANGVSASDALHALRIAAGLISFTADELAHGDVAPMVNRNPQPDGKIGIDDVVVILRKVVGLLEW